MCLCLYPVTRCSKLSCPIEFWLSNFFLHLLTFDPNSAFIQTGCIVFPSNPVGLLLPLWIYESRSECSNTLSLKITYVTLNINDIFDRTIIHISKDRFLAWASQQTISFAITSKALMFQLLDAIIWSQKYSQNSELRGQCEDEMKHRSLFHGLSNYCSYILQFLNNKKVVTQNVNWQQSHRRVQIC